MTTLIIPNDEMEDIIKIVKYLENFGLLLKGVTETIQNEVKEQKGGFLSMLLGTLGASLLGDFLTEKEYIEQEKVREQIELVMETKWIFNTAPSFN